MGETMAWKRDGVNQAGRRAETRRPVGPISGT